MKKGFTAVLALSMILCLAACGGYGAASGGEGSETVSGSTGPAAPLPAADYTPLYERYTDVSALPVLDIGMDSVCVFDDRTLALECPIDNGPELLTYNLSYYIASAQFDRLMELVGEEEHIQTAMGNERANFEEGLYCTETTIHRLTTLTAEDLDRVSDFEKESVLNLIDAFDFEEYVVVEAEKSWKYNEAYAAAEAQLDDGERYMRYCLFAKTEKVPEFKLFGVYWEDFLTA